MQEAISKAEDGSLFILEGVEGDFVKPLIQAHETTQQQASFASAGPYAQKYLKDYKRPPPSSRPE